MGDREPTGGKSHPDPAPAPAPERPARHRPWWLAGVVLVVVGALVVTAVSHLTGGPTRSAAPTHSTPAASAPTSAGLPPASAGPQPVYRLADNPLFTPGQGLAPATCALPGYPHDIGGRNAFYTAARGCLDAAWQPLLGRAGLPFDAGKVVLFGDKVTTPCGQDLAAEQAFYCGDAGTIYLAPGSFDKQVPDSDTGVFLAILAHEYGHHVQELSGVFPEAADKRDKAGDGSPAGLEISRRIELQANCFAGMFFAAVNGHGSVTAKTVRQARFDMSHRGDTRQGPADHGSLTNSGRWFDRGLHENSTAACNTWVAPPADVS